MAFLNHFTRGGQVALHKVRMLRQIVWVTGMSSLLMGVSVWTIKSYLDIPSRYVQDIGLYIKAHGMLFTNFIEPDKVTQQVMVKGHPVMMRSMDIINHPGFSREFDHIGWILLKNLKLGIWSGCGMAFLMILFFVLRGRTYFEKEHHRGREEVSLKTLRRMIRRKDQASPFRIGGLPLIRDKETAHLLLTGTTGSGKSTALHELLPQIRGQGHSAVIVDLTGECVSRYYDSACDVILNPFDARSVSWNPWKECHTRSQLDALAESLIPGNTQQDPFWNEAGRTLLRVGMERLSELGQEDPELLMHLLCVCDLKDLGLFFAGTEAASLTAPTNEKTTNSIRSTLTTTLSGLTHLRQDPQGFSIRSWVHQVASQDPSNTSPKPWLFLSAKPDQRKTLKPLLSAWMDVAILALMSESPHPNRRLWFILDELPALNRLPSLPQGLAEIRKYGGAFVCGLQSIPQLEEVYGRAQSQNLLNLFNTFFCFRSNDPTTATWISKIMGEREYTVPQENLSYGANTMRDGVNMNAMTRTSPLFLPTQISDLPDLTALAKLPGSWPVTQVRVKPQKIRAHTEYFVPSSQRGKKKN